MPRRKRDDRISGFHQQQVERQASLLGNAIEAATREMTFFCPHNEGLVELRETIRRTINILNDRDPDYRPPHDHAGGLRRQGE